MEVILIWPIGCPIFHFFLIELHPCNHACSWVVWVHKKDFSVIDQKLTFGERFSSLHFLEGINAQNRPQNQQNWNLAKIGPKSDFRAYFGHFSLVKSAKNKIAFLQQKECSNQKIEENKSGLEFNFLWKSKCASLDFDFWFLTEPYWPSWSLPTGKLFSKSNQVLSIYESCE